MSKNTNTTTNEYTVTLREYMMSYTNVSIRKLAAHTGINYGILLKLSKQPIPGVPYDPEAINYDAVEEKLLKKEINYAKLDWAAMNTGRTTTLSKSVDDFKVGDEVYLRKNNEVPYVIVYKTETHVVIMLKGTSEPQAWSNNTFMLNGPAFEPRANKTEAEVEEA